MRMIRTRRSSLPSLSIRSSTAPLAASLCLPMVFIIQSMGKEAARSRRNHVCRYPLAISHGEYTSFPSAL
eukprot:scaffold53887_cov57-Phaeocystis_antarctica.AAC.4